MPFPASRCRSLPALCSGEPYRIFFPLGLLVGIIGLSLWPLFIWGGWKVYPSVVHAKLMVEGFMGAFILGFLGTAGPRLLACRGLSGRELAALLSLYTAAMGAHLAGWITMGDAFFLALLLSFAGMLGSRFARSETLPPPNFVLVACGILSAIVGVVLLLVAGNLQWARLYVFGSLLLNQGFVLLPVLGVGVFLFPRLLGTPSRPPLAEIRALAPSRKRKALIAAGTALVILASFAVESFGHVREAGALRFCAAAAYLATQVPAVLKFGRCLFLGQCVRAAMWMLLLGLLWPVLLPGYRIAGLHLVFIGGFMLVVLTVATRVILGHSGQSHRFHKPLPVLIVAAVLLLLGLGARIGADFMPSLSGRNVHLAYAALSCIAAAVLWGIRIVPAVLTPDSEE